MLIQVAALEAAARTVTGKKWLNDAEKKHIEHGTPFDLNAILGELNEGEDDDEDDEGNGKDADPNDCLLYTSRCV